MTDQTAQPDLAVVMAAGEGTRWNNHRGVPKHLVVVDGEPILRRTVRLLKEHLDEVVVIAPHGDDRYFDHDGDTCTITPRPYDVDKFLSSHDIWRGRDVLLVYGDCFFTEEAIATMANLPTRFWRLFCRPGPSQITGCPWGECFGYRLPPGHQSWFTDRCYWLAGQQALGQIHRSGGWEVFRAMMRWPVDIHQTTTEFCVYIDDFTDDFDYPDDFERWLKRWESAK